jgi:hypothetical protein
MDATGSDTFQLKKQTLSPAGLCFAMGYRKDHLHPWWVSMLTSEPQGIAAGPFLLVRLAFGRAECGSKWR